MNLQFSGCQTLQIPLPEDATPIHNYLRQPQRLVRALVDPTRVEVLEDGAFRLKMRPLNFLHLSVQPTVDIVVWSSDRGTMYLKSTACQIKGFDYIDKRFALSLVGYLRPDLGPETRVLSGRADLEVAINSPTFLSLAPRPLLISTGNSLVKRILLTMKHRLASHLLLDYRQWSQAQAWGQVARPSQTLTLSLPPPGL